MRAAMQDRYGDPDVLHEAKIDRPIPTAGQVLVRVSAASVNGYDVLLRSGALKLTTGRAFPKQSGIDFVGSVAEAFAGSPFQAGAEVWGYCSPGGGIAEFVAIEPHHLSLRPRNLTTTEAAALPVVGTTALFALRDVAALRSGERLLIRGASGGVGSIAVQLGKAMGARVTGLASAPNLAFVRELGVDEALDYGKIDPGELGRYDVILDTVGRDIAAWRALLAPAGRMAAIVPDLRRPLRWLAYVALSRVHGGRRVRYFNARPDTALLAELARHVEQGTVRPIIDEVFPIARIADAHRAFETSGSRGKQIISLD